MRTRQRYHKWAELWYSGEPSGSVAERFKALVLKTSDGKPSVSSNLTASAMTDYNLLNYKYFFLKTKNSPYKSPCKMKAIGVGFKERVSPHHTSFIQCFQLDDFHVSLILVSLFTIFHVPNATATTLPTNSSGYFGLFMVSTAQSLASDTIPLSLSVLTH